MLPAAHRLRSAAEFAAVTRSGRRARGGELVVYLLRRPVVGDGCPVASRFGLVVGKKVGSSVIRHRVSRRLRAQLALRLDSVPAGAHVVVRALPGASMASSDSLGRALDGALAKLTASAARA